MNTSVQDAGTAWGGVMDSACHGSRLPLGHTVLELPSVYLPPYRAFVAATLAATVSAVNCGPNVSVHCCTKNCTGTWLPNTWLAPSVLWK
jgi:hypothetical protein